MPGMSIFWTDRSLHLRSIGRAFELPFVSEVISSQAAYLVVITIFEKLLQVILNTLFRSLFGFLGAGSYLDAPYGRRPAPRTFPR